MQQLRKRSSSLFTSSRSALKRAKVTMAQSAANNKTYKETIAALNSLQSNAATILLSQRQKPSHEQNLRKLKNTLIHLEATGVKFHELGKLSVIHVTGTKGKGSTCAACETILQNNGYKTGFFSSPHLISVRERIRINGKPLQENMFIKYFWEVKQALNKFEGTNIGLPHYFSFLFVMAVNVFLKEHVDVAVVEVGIGGQYDTTNVLPNVAVVGITNIGLDHTNILGSTISEIAWQKAGIMKPSAVAFTVPNQISSAMEVLVTRSAELHCPLSVVPLLGELVWPTVGIKISVMKLPSVHQTNIALAVQLAEAWRLRKDGKAIKGPPLLEVTASTAAALVSWSMPGRMQILPGQQENIKYFLDGAHTPESMIQCLDWFKNATRNRNNQHFKETCQVLICNVTGSRDLRSVLSSLVSHNFDYVYFTPNVGELNNNSGECWSSIDVSDFQKKRLVELEVLWLKERSENVASQQHVKKIQCVAEALEDVRMMALQSRGTEFQLLITGSLHLVGSALSLLDPTLERSYYS